MGQTGINPEQPNHYLPQILEAANSILINLRLDSVLQELVGEVHTALGFDAVALSLVDTLSGYLEVAAHIGLDGEAHPLWDANAPMAWSQLSAILDERFRSGQCYFIPYGGANGRTAQGYPDPGGIDTTAWHPEDILTAVIDLGQGRVTGVVTASKPANGRRPSRDVLDALSAFASLAAVAIRNAEIFEQAQRQSAERKHAEDALRRLNEELEQRVIARTAELTKANRELLREISDRKQAEMELRQLNRELLSLQSAAVATASSLDLQFVLDTVTWEMANLLDVETCTILEWNQDTDIVEVIARYDSLLLAGDASAPDQLVSFPVRERVIRERYARYLTVNQAHLSSVDLTYLQQTGIKAVLLLPMVFQDRVVGLVELANYEHDRVFTDREISLAQLLATQAASAIENARLYQRAQQVIAERLHAEARIKASLREKEVLLQEIHHRVKNNLQIISSMLNLQSNHVDDPQALEILRDSQNRIRSMALIHEKLYRSDDLAKVDLGDYVRNLASYLVQSYHRASIGPVELLVDANSVLLTIEQAVPCGLIINELLSNALKHAFNRKDGTRPEQQGGRHSQQIYIRLVQDEDHRLNMKVADNGVGFPPTVDFRNTESLGLQIVNTLVSQLSGTIDLESSAAGTAFTIIFPVLPAGKFEGPGREATA
jgi:two-component sensor histidine kinase